MILNINPPKPEEKETEEQPSQIFENPYKELLTLEEQVKGNFKIIGPGFSPENLHKRIKEEILNK